MSDVKISKVNEVYIRVDCDSGVAMEISEFFCFKVPGYQFMPSYRNKMWDGNIRLFNRVTKLLYRGLLEYLKTFCESRSYSITIDSECKAEAKSNLKHIDTLAARGKTITPHYYQLEAFEHAIRNERALLLSPTASGKSLIIYMIMRWYIERFPQRKFLVVVPTTSLVEQMYTDFEDYSSADKSFDASKSCHRIYSGKDKTNFDQQIVITTWQSIFRLPKKWFLPFGAVIGDEAHGFKSKSLTKIMESLENAAFRIGTTGTLDGTHTHKLVLEGVFGPVYHVTSTKKLIEEKKLSQLSINLLMLSYNDEDRKAAKGLKYTKEIDLIVSHNKRNTFVRNLALKQTGNTLVLFNYVAKHGKPLFESIRKHADDGRKVFFVSGAVSAEAREEIRAITEKEEDAIIVASLGTFSTGVNIRNLHNIIFASPSKSQIRILQSIGRGLRKSDDGRGTVIYDIVDDLSWKSSKNFAMKHAAERVKIYSKEGFKFKNYKVNV